MKRKITFAVMLLVLPAAADAQLRLSLSDAVQRALESRASLKAEAERIAIAEGARRQAALLPNPEFQFQNENLRPGQTYGRDVDTLAMINQPLDILGKRKARIGTADRAVAAAGAEFELARWQVVERVRLAYWNARGLQEIRNVLQLSAASFQRTVDFHSAQFSVGAIAEQDLLRVQLEHEKLRIGASTAAIEAQRAMVALGKEVGQTDFPAVELIDALEPATVREPLTIEQVLAQRADVLAARAALEHSEASARMQDVAARPDLNVTYGYKRTQLPDTATGVNTAMAAVRITLPFTDKNQGNRAAAQAEVRRAKNNVAAVEAAVRADYFGALEEFRQRREELESMIRPLREHAVTIAQIANAAYEQGGTDLLRFLDAERARLDAEVTFIRGLIDYRQSIARLEAAEGVTQ